jgi:hypothetical protein
MFKYITSLTRRREILHRFQPARARHRRDRVLPSHGKELRPHGQGFLCAVAQLGQVAERELRLARTSQLKGGCSQELAAPQRDKPQTVQVDSPSIAAVVSEQAD